MYGNNNYNGGSYGQPPQQQQQWNQPPQQGYGQPPQQQQQYGGGGAYPGPGMAGGAYGVPQQQYGAPQQQQYGAPQQNWGAAAQPAPGFGPQYLGVPIPAPPPAAPLTQLQGYNPNFDADRIRKATKVSEELAERRRGAPSVRSCAPRQLRLLRPVQPTRTCLPTQR
jgi:annexin A7/11